MTKKYIKYLIIVIKIAASLWLLFIVFPFLVTFLVFKVLPILTKLYINWIIENSIFKIIGFNDIFDIKEYLKNLRLDMIIDDLEKEEEIEEEVIPKKIIIGEDVVADNELDISEKTDFVIRKNIYTYHRFIKIVKELFQL